MRVLQWSNLYWPDIGGIETTVRSLSAALTRLGHEVVVVASSGPRGSPGRLSVDEIEVHRFDFWRALERRELGLVARLRRAVAELKRTWAPDIVHLHFSAAGAFFHQSTRDAVAAPTLLSLHGDLGGLPSAAPDTLLGSLLGCAAHVTADSSATLRSALDLCPTVEERASVAYNGVTPPPRPAPLPEDAGLRVLCVGRLEREKGFDVAIQAVARLRDRWPRLHLTVAGSGPFGQELQGLARRTGVDVCFVGFVTQQMLEELWTQASVVCVPSRMADSFPLVPLEAAMRARPVVASRLGGLPEAVVDGVTGRLVPAEDPDALADALVAVLGKTGEARRLGLAARERALRLHSLQAMAATYDDLYRRITKGGPA